MQNRSFLISISILSVAVILLVCAGRDCSAVELILRNAPMKVCFSPRAGCTDAIIDEINHAKFEILVQAYSFTSAPIAQALLKSHRRGVKVEAILDKSQMRERYTSATFLSNSGIPTYIDDRHAIAHNKVIVIDGEIVLTGSFNFTKAAEEKNAENLVIIRSRELASIYMKNWKAHREHSVIYSRPGDSSIFSSSGSKP